MQENPKYPTHFLTVIFIYILKFVPFLIIIITEQDNTHKGTELLSAENKTGVDKYN